MNYKSIVFDLDGTLLDTLADISTAANTTLTAFNQPPRNLPFFFNQIGGGTRNMIQQAIPNSLSDSELEEIINAYLIEYRQNYSIKTKVFSGLEVALDQIKDLNVKLGILTNKPHDIAVKLTKTHLNNWKFDCVKGHSFGEPLKPSRELSETIAEELESDPREILYIGDTKTDIQTARNVGFRFLGVTWGYQSRDSLIKSGASNIVDDPLDLANKIKLMI